MQTVYQTRNGSPVVSRSKFTSEILTTCCFCRVWLFFFQKPEWTLRLFLILLALLCRAAARCWGCQLEAEHWLMLSPSEYGYFAKWTFSAMIWPLCVLGHLFFFSWNTDLPKLLFLCLKQSIWEMMLSPIHARPLFVCVWNSSGHY